MSMRYRMQRTLPRDRAALIMPVDHGLIFDRIEGLETPGAPFAAWGSHDVTGFMLTPGQLRQSEDWFVTRPHLSRVLAIDTFYDYRQQDGAGAHALITSVEEAIRLGADAVKMLFPWNLSNDARAALCHRVGEVVAACEAWDIPLVLEPVIMGANRTDAVINQEERVARIAFELGAHIIKIAFPGEVGTKRLVEELGVPVVVAGGSLSGSTADNVEAVRQSVRGGARGVIVGRNVWQRARHEGDLVLAEIAGLTRTVRFE
jgi:class I fructose-bisphosphate aldolase